METKRELIKNQIKLFRKIQSNGLNIVTCGNCGTTIIHEMGDEKIDCFGCKRQMSSSDCPDYWYEGDELSAVFDEEEDLLG